MASKVPIFDKLLILVTLAIGFTAVSCLYMHMTSSFQCDRGHIVQEEQRALGFLDILEDEG